MNKDIFLKKMQDAVNNPRLTALFVELQMSVGHTDKHYYEVYCGFQYLKQYIDSGDVDLLEKAIRQFDYVQSGDLKYVMAISFYGKAIAYAYYQDGNGFSKAYSWLNGLIGMWTSFATDRVEFIEELKTEARHLKEDIKAWDMELNPFMSRFRNWF